jgi:hypothetical protein
LLQNPPYPYLKLGNRFDDSIRHTLGKGERAPLRFLDGILLYPIRYITPPFFVKRYSETLQKL